MGAVLASPHSTSATVGAITNTASSVVAVDAIGAGASSGGGNAASLLTASSWATQAEQQFRIEHLMGVSSGGLAAHVDCDSDVVVTLVATSFTTVWVRIDQEYGGTAGAALPLLEVDVSNDGVLEYSNAPGQPVPPPATIAPFPMVVGPTPTPVRLHLASSLAIDGNASFAVTFNITPAPFTSATKIGFGCDGLANSMLASPLFDGSVTFSAFPSQAAPVVLVLGLGVQPILLPPAGAALPCVLFPSPDLILFMAPGAGGFLQSTLPLPPAVRPVTFWAQGVRIAPQGLLTTDTLQVDAH